MSAVRSMTLMPAASPPKATSRLRCCPGDSSSSSTTVQHPSSRIARFTSATLPVPMKVFGLRSCMRWYVLPTTSSPAVPASSLSSSSDSCSEKSSSVRPDLSSSPTRKHFSRSSVNRGS